jgi:hypothetical protein
MLSESQEPVASGTEEETECDNDGRNESMDHTRIGSAGESSSWDLMARAELAALRAERTQSVSHMRQPGRLRSTK